MVALVAAEQAHEYDPDCGCQACRRARVALAREEHEKQLLRDDGWLYLWGLTARQPWSDFTRSENPVLTKHYGGSEPVTLRYLDIANAVQQAVDPLERAVLWAYYALRWGAEPPRLFPGVEGEIELEWRHRLTQYAEDPDTGHRQVAEYVARWYGIDRDLEHWRRLRNRARHAVVEYLIYRRKRDPGLLRLARALAERDPPT